MDEIYKYSLLGIYYIILDLISWRRTTNLIYKINKLIEDTIFEDLKALNGPIWPWLNYPKVWNLNTLG